MEPDACATAVGFERLDMLRFEAFLQHIHAQDFSTPTTDWLQKLKDLRIVTSEGRLSLAGAVMFAEQPELILPHAGIVAIRYCDDTAYTESITANRAINGPLSGVFSDAKAFVMRHLHKVQAGQGVNAPGLPEIPETVIAEILVNALVHRDYLIPAPIRISVFENRIEVVSPGHLPGDLTMKTLRTGQPCLRNPLIASYAARGLLPFKGSGFGIQKAVSGWPNIDFIDDHAGNRFIVTLARKSLMF